MSDERTPAPYRKTSLPAPAPSPDRRSGRVIIDAEFRAVGPLGRAFRALRDHWWALGPYLFYCFALWALAALVWWIESARR
jgi:hypothetical protein